MALLIDSVVSVELDNLIGLICSQMDHFPKIVSILVRLIFLTPDWTKLANLVILEKCLYYTWIQFKKDETSDIFVNVENVFQSSIRHFLHTRRATRDIQGIGRKQLTLVFRYFRNQRKTVHGYVCSVTLLMLPNTKTICALLYVFHI